MQRVRDTAVTLSAVACAILVLALLSHVKWGTIPFGRHGYLRGWDSEFYVGSGTPDESGTVALSGSFAGVAWMRVLPPVGSNTRQDWLVRVPYLQLALVAGIAPAFRIVRRVRAARRATRRQRRGLCPSCGYDLRASPAQCPECGAIAGHGAPGAA